MLDRMLDPADHYYYPWVFHLGFMVNFVIVSRYRRAAQRGRKFDLRLEGRFIMIALRATALAGLAYLIVYAINPRWVSATLIEMPIALRWTGAFIAFFVTPPFIHWAQSSLGKNVSPTITLRDDHSLITIGPYRYIRHPLYTAGMTLYTGLFLISGTWPFFAALIFGFIVILARLPKEEANLRARFGADYDAYAARTGRFFPKIRRAG